jgi:MFS family permease
VKISLTRARTEERLVTPLFLLVMLSTLGYFTAIGAIVPTLPRYVEGPLAHGSLAVGLTVGAFALSAVVLRPFVGRISDKRGRRLLITAGGIGVGAAIAAYALVDSLSMLVALRVVTGIGEAFYYVGVASVISDISPANRRGEAFSYFSLALFGGLALGPVVGETLLDLSGFSAVWLAAGACSLIAGGLGFLVPDTRPAGAADQGRGRLLHPAALLPGTVLATNIWALATFSSFVPLYALRLGLDGSRFVFVLNSAIILLIRSFGARLPDKLGPRRSGRAALTCTMIGLVTLGVWASPAGLFVGTAIYSIGHALAFPALMTLALSNAPEEERGAVVGTFTAFFDLSFGVGAVSAGLIAGALGYRGAFIAAGVVALAGIVLLFGAAQVAARRSAVAAEEEAMAVGR